MERKNNEWKIRKRNYSRKKDAKENSNIAAYILHFFKEKNLNQTCWVRFRFCLAASYRLCMNFENQIKAQPLWTAFLFLLPIRLSFCGF